MRNVSAAAFLLFALTSACAAQTPATPISPDQRREQVARELGATGCVMPNAPRFRGELGVVAAELARDPDRVMLLRHPEFHTVTPDGRTNTREQMYERTRQFIGRVERFDCAFETITELMLEGDTALAVVDQRTLRHQRFPDGTLHDIRTWVVQRESWKKVDGSWMLWRVDNIQPGITVYDGVLVQPRAS